MRTRTTLNESGSHVIALAFGVLVLGVIGFAGYRVMHMNKTVDGALSSTAAGASVKVPAKITSTADLTKTVNALDSTTSQLDSTLNDAALDADLNSLL